MYTVRTFGAVLAVLAAPALAHAAGNKPPLDVPYWTVTPFVVLLLSIAILPMVAGHWWHSNRNKGLVSAVLSLLIVGYLYSINEQAAGQAFEKLAHAVGEYASFIILLGSLYVVAGGIVVRGDIQATPLTNAGILALGAVLANFIGTTGASMVLIRPVLRINQERRRVSHIPIFFIFLVSNLGGLLTPLGDPPLFLGFLRGVDFFWTLGLWKQWLLANGTVLLVFFVWDVWAYRHERPRDIQSDVQHVQPIRVVGLINLLFLGGIVGGVLLKSALPGDELLLTYLPEALLVLIAIASLALTPRGLRGENRFSWEPIVEVAVLFAGIFVTMIPALQLLALHADDFKTHGLTEAWQYFWLTGTLSSFLDNAPTYLTFATLAAGPEAGGKLGVLMDSNPQILAAVSGGAVFMGANTYIGNGPNFMVKAISDASGYRMPGFFGYMLYSGLILLPIFAFLTLVMFSG